jgi:rubredoxin
MHRRRGLRLPAGTDTTSPSRKKSSLPPETASPPLRSGPFKEGRTVRDGQAFDTWRFVCSVCGLLRTAEAHCLSKPMPPTPIRFNEWLDAFVCRQCDNMLWRRGGRALREQAGEFSKNDPHFMRVVMLCYLRGLAKTVTIESRQKGQL